jgi:NAD(P)-dependent dehydrogenase (short-subunit alcohol dehydrogenase family)
LKEKVAVVIGGGSGIGLATAKRFVSEGAHVFILGRNKKELDLALSEIGSKNVVVGIDGDVSNLADLEKLYNAVKEQKD